MCKAGDNFNLSFESLTSRAALRLLLDVQENQPDLWAKITASRSGASGLTEPTEDSLESPYEEEQDFDDDTSVPFDALAAHVGSDDSVLPDGIVLGGDGSLLTVNTAEVYETGDGTSDGTSPDSGPTEGESGSTEGESSSTEGGSGLGRGKRTKQVNKQYDAFWRH